MRTYTLHDASTLHLAPAWGEPGWVSRPPEDDMVADRVSGILADCADRATAECLTADWEIMLPRTGELVCLAARAARSGSVEAVENLGREVIALLRSELDRVARHEIDVGEI